MLWEYIGVYAPPAACRKCSIYSSISFYFFLFLSALAVGGTSAAKPGLTRRKQNKIEGKIE
jgi:hypothetical protein